MGRWGGHGPMGVERGGIGLLWRRMGKRRRRVGTKGSWGKRGGFTASSWSGHRLVGSKTGSERGRR